jgi:uncharacterized membrane protein
MSISCPQCHAEMPDKVVFCPGCGRRMWVPGQEAAKPPTRPPAITSAEPSAESAPPAGIPMRRGDNLIAASAYVAVVPAIVFVLVEPFKRNRFVRFHSFQSIFLAGATILIAIAMRILYSLLALIPALGFLLAWLATGVTLLGLVILWLVLLVKALQGQTFKLPFIGNLAEKA